MLPFSSSHSIDTFWRLITTWPRKSSRVCKEKKKRERRISFTNRTTKNYRKSFPYHQQLIWMKYMKNSSLTRNTANPCSSPPRMQEQRASDFRVTLSDAMRCSQSVSQWVSESLSKYRINASRRRENSDAVNDLKRTNLLLSAQIARQPKEGENLRA